MANETINWYPGHMKKATRMMEDSLRLVDAVVELRDARIPNSSRNPDVERIVGSKPRRESAAFSFPAAKSIPSAWRTSCSMNSVRASSGA